MESVGRLAGGVAHDFNNMLGVILGRAELAMLKEKNGHPVLGDLLEIKKGAERSAEITRQLLAFARKQTIFPTALDLNHVTEGILKMLRRLIGENIRLSWIPGAGLWPVRMDRSQVDQILANLCVNSRDAIAGGGNITIETRNIVLDVTFCDSHPGLTPGDYVLLSVEDNGCGMGKETLDKLFEPFFTTKEIGKGTGLGLAMIYGIVKQNRGYITVNSELNVGTTFRIYLPRHRGETDALPTPTNPEMPMARGRETVLVVEDDKAMLEISQIMLEELDYHVLTASLPEEAIRLACEYDGMIDLLLTDVVMPGMNGRKMAEKILSLHPGLKVLFMSGYTADVVVHDTMLEEGAHFIEKPFSLQELAAKLRQTFDRHK
jgi:CheY-like chemotaxis protein